MFGLSSADLDDAFTKLSRKNKDGAVMIQRDALLSVLQNKGSFPDPPDFRRIMSTNAIIFHKFFPAGEHMTEGELSELLSTLLGIADLGGSAEVGVSQKENLITLLKTHLPERISADMFVGKVLGFATGSKER